jgi:hypothetical protein
MSGLVNGYLMYNDSTSTHFSPYGPYFSTRKNYLATVYARCYIE